MNNTEFKSHLTAKKPLLDAFLKIPHPIIVEVMARAGFDFLVVDAEHVPFNRRRVDAMVLAERAADCPIVVRVPVSTADWVLNVLDAEAAGVMVAHVDTADQPRASARSVAYEPGGLRARHALPTTPGGPWSNIWAQRGANARRSARLKARTGSPITPRSQMSTVSMHCSSGAPTWLCPMD